MQLDRLEERFLIAEGHDRSVAAAWAHFLEMASVPIDGVPPLADSYLFEASPSASDTKPGISLHVGRGLALSENGDYVGRRLLVCEAYVPLDPGRQGVERVSLLGTRATTRPRVPPFARWRELVEGSAPFVAAVQAPVVTVEFWTGYE